MTGYLDELDQAFLTIDTGQGALDFQFDPGFSGALVAGHGLFGSPEDDGAEAGNEEGRNGKGEEEARLVEE